VTVHRANLGRTFKTLFELVRNRAREVAEGGPAQVFELLVEAVLHDYKPILEDWQDTLDGLEQQAIRGSSEAEKGAHASAHGNPGIAERILGFKKLVTAVRQALLREEKVLEAFHERVPEHLLGRLPRSRFRSLHLELRDLIVEFEKLRELAVSVFQVYAAVLNLEISQSGHHMNKIMERLAVVTSVFMPLTFIVGVYGMNIPGIPELELPSFYYILWGVMISIAALLLWVFKRLRWY
jgi:Mg2+ and Co2+ transporter CorA